MKRNIYRALSFLVFAVFVALAFVQPSPTHAIDFCTSAQATGFAVPGCSGKQGLPAIITGVLNVVFFLSFLLVLFFLVWGGLKWVLAQGEKENITKAREQVTNSLIGLVVILGSYLLLNLAMNLILGTSFDKLQNVNLTGQIGN